MGFLKENPQVLLKDPHKNEYKCFLFGCIEMIKANIFVGKKS